MKIVALTENTSKIKGIDTEHGLSLYIEVSGRKILFDTGQSELFSLNAQKCGIDLAEVDTAVLSHGHYDHGGGIKRFCEINGKANVFLSRYAFEPHFSGEKKYIGLDNSLSAGKRIVFCGEHTDLGNGIELEAYGSEICKYPVSGFNMNVLRDAKFIPDDFRHEQYMMINDGSRRILFSGCSHRGILNIMTWAHPDIFIGGFHFKGLDTDNPAEQEILFDAANKLNAFDTEYYTCHCTGTEQYKLLKSVLCDKLRYLSCGQQITLK